MFKKFNGLCLKTTGNIVALFTNIRMSPLTALVLLLLVVSVKTNAQTAESEKIVKEYVKKVQLIDSKMDKLQTEEGEYNKNGQSGHYTAFLENSKPLRIAIDMVVGNTSQSQVFNYENGKIYFAYIVIKESNEFLQFFIRGNKLILFIDANQKMVSQDNKLFLKYEKDLQITAKALYALSIKQAKKAPKNSVDGKLDQYSTVTNTYCSLIAKQNNGANVYMALNDATIAFANMNQELSGMIENRKFSKRQYNRFIKITEKYEGCQ